jgi:hypothetical protein
VDLEKTPERFLRLRSSSPGPSPGEREERQSRAGGEHEKPSEDMLGIGGSVQGRAVGDDGAPAE